MLFVLDGRFFWIVKSYEVFYRGRWFYYLKFRGGDNDLRDECISFYFLGLLILINRNYLVE